MCTQMRVIALINNVLAPVENVCIGATSSAPDGYVLTSGGGGAD